MSKVAAVLKVLLAEQSAEDYEHKDPIFGAVWKNPSYDEAQLESIFEMADEFLDILNPDESDWQTVMARINKPDDRATECELDVGDLILFHDDGTISVLIGMELTTDQCAAAFA